MTDNVINWALGSDGIVVLTLDDPSQSTNTWNTPFRQSLADVVDRLEADRDGYVGVIITSGKEVFSAGADLKEIGPLMDRADAAEIATFFDHAKALLRRLERLGKPVVAAINGTALGGGLELALAAHHRIAPDRPGIQIGLPEVTLGVIPGAGGVVRTVRMFGVAAALTNVLLNGTKFSPRKALAAGLVDAVVDTDAELLPAARAWITANPAPVQPWDRKSYTLPGGPVTGAELSQQVLALSATLRKQLKGADLPAPRNLIAAAIEGSLVDFAAAETIETRYLVNLSLNPLTANGVQSFFDLQKANRNDYRPAGVAPFRPTKVAVVGAGMMGAGIAYEYAKAGVAVALKDISVEAAERGKSYSRTLAEAAVAKGRWTRQRADELLNRITAAADDADLAGADLMIEAVFEDPGLKKKTYAQVEPVLDATALLASNTSQIPITGLAEGVTRPEAFIGMHFSSPVDKMPMVEVVKGALTSRESVSRAVDVVRLINKTPIVVNDGRGFYLTRLFMAATFEACEMVADGVPATSIEQAALQNGMLTQPLLVLDQVSLSLSRSIIADREAETGTDKRTAGEGVIIRMVDQFGRLGRAAGAGFYDYADGKRLTLWPGLSDAFGPARDIPFQDLRDRYLFRVALEVAACLQEGIVETTATANVGSVMGGFPAGTGGALSFINSYDGGPSGFVARARELAQTYGERFLPPAVVVDAATNGTRVGH
ncbi:3-hydroxyacyl-CoA dehydrogenase NAD-binding domain-containing protein [[Mycobacterium] nativiensis]|uniref:3-hydroxyacyl-CoA dehydrogenase NAD-binding domain-containing protein n=1 Tax=[Mycobacterium] nativiensis TaxID=2855503 RepID=A0ABU5XPV2_9MYCO|nr:3-hydroxyacyl-CoA dehydrogenase NAD-binding domain-containing protein [Mycolicibacter sp. MYC340]MEB3030001.1 3-hydroxyacyl-CoA dehydrogenase NAD-binding domain-containing protein [Mycolicibacter sp. MYC340]